MTRTTRDRARDMLDFAGELQAQGVANYPQVSPRTLDIHVNWDGGMSWFALEKSWHAMVQAPRADKAGMLRDPQWRSLARQEWDQVPRTMIPHKHADRIRLVSVTRPENERWVGATLADLAADRGGHPSDVLADWLLANDAEAGIVGVGVANSDAGGVADTLTHQASVMANSDAGAHLQMMCAIGDTTLMLTRHVRDRGDLTVEQAVHRMTGQLAERFGFTGRGRVSEGAVGDLVVFGLDELDWATDVFVSDLPRGARRLRRPAGGYRYTVVGGAVVQEARASSPGRAQARCSGRAADAASSYGAVPSCAASHSWCRAKWPGSRSTMTASPWARTVPVLARVNSPATYQRWPSRRTVQARACNGRAIGTGLT